MATLSSRTLSHRTLSSRTLSYRTAAGLAAATLALLLGGCAGGASAGSGEAQVQGPVQLDEASNGRTVTVPFGGRVVVELHNTYWQMAPVVGGLQPIGEPQVTPSRCPVRGSGCGSVTFTYNAAVVGHATLHAHRSSCGEAIRCTGSSGDWQVQVVIR